MNELLATTGVPGVGSWVLAQSEAGISPHLTGLVSVILLFGGPMLVAIAWIVAQAWLKASTHANDTELKHRLLDAGMSVDEIERVMNAGQQAEVECVKSGDADGQGAVVYRSKGARAQNASA